MAVYGLQTIGNGSAGTADTLRLMCDVINKAKVMPIIRELALEITRGVRNKDWLGEAKAIQDWVKKNIRYTLDIRGVETLQTPENTLRLGAGDCDDHSMLVAALLASIGHATRVKAIAQSGERYCHVLPEVRINGKWVTVETTEKVSVGWQPKSSAYMVWYV